MKKNIIFSLILILFACELLAVDRCQFQSCVPSPESVNTGKQVMFQVLIQNLGTETWEENQYSAYVEIYDSKEKYITKTDSLTGDISVSPSQMVLLYIPYLVPENEQEGLHKYRIVLNHKGKRILYTDILGFNVQKSESDGSVKIPGGTLFYGKSGSEGLEKGFVVPVKATAGETY